MNYNYDLDNHLSRKFVGKLILCHILNMCSFNIYYLSLCSFKKFVYSKEKYSYFLFLFCLSFLFKKF